MKKAIAAFAGKLSAWFDTLAQSRYTLPIVLSLGFLFRLLLYFNTTQFEFIAESGTIFEGLDKLRQGDWVYIYGEYYVSGLSYVAYFFERVFGSLFWFFFFQCILATATLYFVYRITLQISDSRFAALISLLLATVYIDFALLPAVMYTQTMEVFFTTCAILALFNAIKATNVVRFAAWAAGLFVILYLSLLFRATLHYFYFSLLFLFFISVFQKKENKLHGVRYLISFVAFFLLFKFFSPVHLFADPGIRPINDFMFFGHTDYGGNGGEGAFIYQENADRYQQALEEFMARNDIDDPTREDITNFQQEEIVKFVTQHPLRWVLLQFRKVVFTYGIVPARDSAIMLLTGRAPLGLIPSLLLIELSFVTPILLFFIFIRWAKVKEMATTGAGQALILTFFYLIAVTSLYGHYQERYRIVVMVSCIMPFAGFLFDSSYLGKILNDKKILWTKILTLLLVLAVWGYQLYLVFLAHGDRYQNAIDSINNLN